MWLDMATALLLLLVLVLSIIPCVQFQIAQNIFNNGPTIDLICDCHHFPR